MNLRLPKTQNERRQWMECEDLIREFPDIIGCRRRRSFKELPTAYDDIYIRPWSRRSWKYYRDQQYKVSIENKEELSRPNITYEAVRVCSYARFSWRHDCRDWHFFRVRRGYRRYLFEKWDGATLSTTFGPDDDMIHNKKSSLEAWYDSEEYLLAEKNLFDYSEMKKAFDDNNT